jgi:hypothetical protein
MAPDRDVPAEFATDTHIRYPESLVRYLLSELTVPGDVVLDPFAGFGTTLIVAEEMNRKGFGMERDKSRAAYAMSQLEHPERLLVCDSSQPSSYESVPAAALSVSSPPYFDYPDIGSASPEYAEYIDSIAQIYGRVAASLKPDAKLVIEMSNLKSSTGLVTTQAWDVARQLQLVLRFEGEIVVGWAPTYCCGYDHSYCLVFGGRV